MSSLVTSNLSFSSLSRSVNLELISWARLAGQWVLGFCLFLFPLASIGVTETCHNMWFYAGPRDLILSPHACVAGTLLTERLPSPQVLSLGPCYKRGDIQVGISELSQDPTGSIAEPDSKPGRRLSHVLLSC